MPQFFLDQELSPGNEVEIRGRDAKHIALSLRLKPGDWIRLSDGAGLSYRARITSASARAVRAAVERQLPARSGPPAPALAIALCSRDRLEWAIQKAVELGCTRIVPFASSRSEPLRAGAEAERKQARWNTIALEAAKQSGLPLRPAVEAPIDFASLCAAIPRFESALFLYEGESQLGLRAALRSRHVSGTRTSQGLLIVGPEGGFSDDEVRAALAAGVVSASLGPQILRVETAVIVGMVLWQDELGNLEPA